jgi:hypothetical protein
MVEILKDNPSFTGRVGFVKAVVLESHGSGYVLFPFAEVAPTVWLHIVPSSLIFPEIL